MVKASSDFVEMRGKAEKDNVATALLMGRLAANSAAALGAWGVFAGGALEALEAAHWKHAQRLGTKRIESLKVWGARLGVAGGGALAALDLVEAFGSYQKDNTGLAAAYFSSFAINFAFARLAHYTTLSQTARTAALMGRTITHITVAGARVPVMAIVVLLVVLYLYVDDWRSSLKREEALQRWLDNCSFGTNPTHYPDLKEEMKGLELAYQTS